MPSLPDKTVEPKAARHGQVCLPHVNTKSDVNTERNTDRWGCYVGKAALVPADRRRASPVTVITKSQVIFTPSHLFRVHGSGIFVLGFCKIKQLHSQTVIKFAPRRGCFTNLCGWFRTKPAALDKFCPCWDPATNCCYQSSMSVRLTKLLETGVISDTQSALNLTVTHLVRPHRVRCMAANKHNLHAFAFLSQVAQVHSPERQTRWAWLCWSPLRELRGARAVQQQGFQLDQDDPGPDWDPDLQPGGFPEQGAHRRRPPARGELSGGVRLHRRAGGIRSRSCCFLRLQAGIPRLSHPQLWPLLWVKTSACWLEHLSLQLHYMIV